MTEKSRAIDQANQVLERVHFEQANKNVVNRVSGDLNISEEEIETIQAAGGMSEFALDALAMGIHVEIEKPNE